MKKVIFFIALALGFSQAIAQDKASELSGKESPWLIRARAVHIETANKSDPFPGVGRNQVTVDDKTIAELDISYFFTPNWAAELILTNPQKQNVRANGNKIGSFTHLPPVLTLQYHFTPQSKISPYVGAGINYTRIWNDNLGGLSLEKDSIGGALQIGVDYKIDRHWLVNFDVKKVQIRSNVSAADGSHVTSVKVDPWLIGVGVGYRF